MRWRWCCYVPAEGAKSWIQAEAESDALWRAVVRQSGWPVGPPIFSMPATATCPGYSGVAPLLISHRSERRWTECNLCAPNRAAEASKAWDCVTGVRSLTQASNAGRTQSFCSGKHFSFFFFIDGKPARRLHYYRRPDDSIQFQWHDHFSFHTTRVTVFPFTIAQRRRPAVRHARTQGGMSSKTPPIEGQPTPPPPCYATLRPTLCTFGDRPIPY